MENSELSLKELVNKSRTKSSGMNGSYICHGDNQLSNNSIKEEIESREGEIMVKEEDDEGRESGNDDKDGSEDEEIEDYVVGLDPIRIKVEPFEEKIGDESEDRVNGNVFEYISLPEVKIEDSDVRTDSEDFKKLMEFAEHDIFLSSSNAAKINAARIREKIPRQDEVSRPHQCDVREKKFERKNHLNEQYNTHSGCRPYMCVICKKAFVRKAHLDNHLVLHSGMNPYKCDQCGKTFTQRDSLKSHYRMHTGLKTYECNFCKMKFSRKGHLITHLNLHTGFHLYECEICRETFTHKISRDTHYGKHTKQRPYQCNVCNKSYAHKSSLTEHNTVHTGIHLFECDVCKKPFNLKSHLTKHYLIHIESWPFVCEICKKGFKWKGALARHLNCHEKEGFRSKERNVKVCNENVKKKA